MANREGGDEGEGRLLAPAPKLVSEAELQALLAPQTAAQETDVAMIVDRPVTPDEVTPPERPRHSATPPSVPAANGTPKTASQTITDLITRQVKRAVGEVAASFSGRLGIIAAVSEASAEEFGRFKEFQQNKNAELSEGVAALRSGIERCVTADTFTAVRSEVGGVRGRVEGLETALRGAEEADRRLENRIAALEAELAAREGRLNDVNAQLAEMRRMIQGFREQVTGFDQTVDNLRVSIREARAVADDAVSGIAALREFQSRAETDSLHLQADIASARNAAQAVDAKVGKLEARMGNIEEFRVMVQTIEEDVKILDMWRRRFRRILEGVDEPPPDKLAGTATH